MCACVCARARACTLEIMLLRQRLQGQTLTYVFFLPGGGFGGAFLAFGAEGGAGFFLKPGGGAGAALRDFMPAGGGSLTVEDCENEEERHHRLVSA